MSDYARSIIRTFVPLLVGSVVTWLAARGVKVDANAVLPAADALVAGTYYALVRWAESRWPGAGWLLGAPGTPSYVADTAVPSIAVSSTSVAGVDAAESPFE